MSRTIIGIDLGTSYSLAALLERGQPVILPNALGERLTPSAVSLGDDDETVLVGAAARARATTHPDRTALAFKRDMGTDRKIQLGPRSFLPQTLSAWVLGSVKRDAEAALGRPIDEAVVTVPAYFGDAQRQATRDAAAIAGLNVERIINEPTAAALAYGLHERHRELKAVVIDLGGGTFDVTVLEILEGVVEIQASSGDARLGGDDFDLRLADLVARQHPGVREQATAWARIKQACEATKKRLGDADEALITLHDVAIAGGRTLQIEMPLTRGDAEAAWTPLLERMRAPILRALRDASLRPEKIDEVLLVGGSTRMPCVARLASQIFGRLPLRTLPPDEAVALGAAVQAGLKAGDVALGDMVVTDIAPFSLGVATGNRFGRHVVEGLFTPIIDRGTVLPASRETTLANILDQQTEITIRVYQGEHSLVRDNTNLGDFTITGLEPLPAGEQLVKVRFTYDLNGILEVDMTPERTGHTQTLVIEGSPGRLSRKQIKEARQAMSRLKFHPRESLPNTTLLARAESLYLELTGIPRDELGHELARFRAALENQDEKAIAPQRSQLMHLVDRLGR